MRTIFTSLAILFASFFVSAYAADILIAGFEDGETGYTINQGHWWNQYDFEVVNNPDINGINNSSKCIKIQTQGAASPDRWGYWLWIDLNEPIEITQENRYLKIMGNRTPNAAQLSVSPMGPGMSLELFNESSYFGFSKPRLAGAWGDMVFDLFRGPGGVSAEGYEAKTFLIFLGTWNATDVEVSYYDNIVLSDNDLPRGEPRIAPGLLADFDNLDLTFRNFIDFGTQSEESFWILDENPIPDDVNPSDSCLLYYKPENTTDWHSLMCYVNGIIPIEYPNIYFHLLAYIPDYEPFTVIFNSPTSKQVQQVIYPDEWAEEGWYDYVVDVSDLSAINQIAIRFNSQAPDKENAAGVYFVNSFLLNDNPEPREAGWWEYNSMKFAKFDTVKILNRKGDVSIVSPDLKAAGVYTVAGQLIAKQAASGGSVNVTLAAGVYVIKAENKVGAVSTHKLIVF